MKLTLETERLRLRPFRMEDAESIFSGWASDPEVTKYLTWNPHKSIRETRCILSMWIAEYEKPERLNFAIELKETQQLIGGIDVVGYLDGVPVLGYNLARRYWGFGYMTEACRCLIGYLFSVGYREIRIDAMCDNTASNRVIQKCGGVLLRTEPDFIYAKNCTMTVNRYIVKAE